MSATAADTLDLELSAFGGDLHAFLDTLPDLLKRGRIAQLRSDCAALLERAPKASGERWAQVQSALAELRQALDRDAARAYLLSKYEEAARAYEQWTAARKQQGAQVAARVASLKPLKGPRTWLHIGMGLIAAVLYEFFLTKTQAEVVLLVLLGVFGSLEISRRLFAGWNRVLVDRLFKPIARPREFDRVNSATWYLLALSLLAPVFSKAEVLTGVLVLAFGDPAAAWIGKAFGKVKLYGNKSLAGSLGFVAVSTLVVSLYLLFLHPDLPLGRRLSAAALSSLVGAAAELFSERLDDNLTVPIASTLAAALLI